jgi:hypothetical protein
MTLTVVMALAAGLASGFLNLWGLRSAGDRLADSGKTNLFVLSSFFRMGLFAIVAGTFAALGPWWTAILYIVALFVPLALYAAVVMRER